MNQTYTIGHYILDRLNQMGIQEVFGVPGDYNLNFLDKIESHDKLSWVGNTNELNAAYAADGYARIKGASALITTFGVGELSAINGIAGSYAEDVPVVKITGAPSTTVINEHKLVHHTLATGNFRNFARMYQEVTESQLWITAETSTLEIDTILNICLKSKKPVNIIIPSDVHDITTNKPDRPLYQPMISDDEQITSFKKMAQNLIKQAKSPVILADYKVNRHQLNNALQQFVEKSGFPVTSLSAGKGVIAETHPQFIGVYNGALSNEETRRQFDAADLVITIGVTLTDSITGGFTHDFSNKKQIDIQTSSATIEGEIFNHVALQDTLQLLTDVTDKKQSVKENILSYSDQKEAEAQIQLDDKALITQETFWPLVETMLQPNDVVIGEQGTSYFGLSGIQLPIDATFVGQPIWGSIGYTLPSLLGTQLADPSRRNILFIGDGSFQLTAQEISNLFRQNLKPVIFVINNDGYTVERTIHGMEAKYNDIPTWKYTELPAVFGGADKSETMVVDTIGDLKAAFAKTYDADKLQLIEVNMKLDDAPELLKAISRTFAEQNGY